MSLPFSVSTVTYVKSGCKVIATLAGKVQGVAVEIVKSAGGAVSAVGGVYAEGLYGSVVLFVIILLVVWGKVDIKDQRDVKQMLLSARDA